MHGNTKIKLPNIQFRDYKNALDKVHLDHKEFISPGTIGLYVRCQQNYELLNTFSLEKSQMLNFREIRPAGATLMFANRRAAMKYLTYSFATTKTPLIKCIWTIKSIYLILMTVRTNSDPFSKQNLKVVALSEECEVLI